jgi:hypothetical protein
MPINLGLGNHSGHQQAIDYTKIISSKQQLMPQQLQPIFGESVFFDFFYRPIKK